MARPVDVRVAGDLDDCLCVELVEGAPHRNGIEQVGTDNTRLVDDGVAMTLRQVVDHTYNTLCG